MKKFSFITVAAVFAALTIASCDKNPNSGTQKPPDDPKPKPDVFVNKTTETSTFLLEELTGIRCGYCPDGHKKADRLADSLFPGKFFVINVHTDYYGEPKSGYLTDLRSDFGEALDTYSKLSGYPAGMINRRVFSSYSMKVGGAAMDRYNWEKAVNSIVGESTYVNVAAKTTINSADRTLTCKVQAYYTDDATTPINNINVAVLQNELIAEQASGSVFYPERVTPDGKYRHMHVLRHLITGQWGETIDIEKKKDNLYEKTFTWTIPADIRTLPILLENVEVLVFITEGEKTPVAKVCKSSIEIK